jgi:hypothetical protein
MKLLFWSFLLIFVSTTAVFSQDVIYTTGGNKLQAKVIEINTNDIKYKDFNNLEGPTYVITKMDVVLIQYANGVSEVINNNPNTIAPKGTDFVTYNSAKPSEKTKPVDKNQQIEKAKPIEKTKPKKKEFNLYYLNNNMISINALALANGDVTLMYDRDILNNKLSLSFLGGYNFNSQMAGLNRYIAATKDNAKKMYDAGFGINYTPKCTRRVQYFVGILGKYMAYNYQSIVDTTNNQYKYKDANAYQLAIMVTNGWVFRVTPTFNFKFFASVGAPINSTRLETSDSDGNKVDFSNYPKIYLGYCFGYRF